MLSVLQCVLIILGTILLSLVFLAALRRIWPASKRTEHNDIIGWQISVLGTTYAVILAFMLWNVWNNFQTARINVEMEANNLVDLYRIAGGLEPGQSKSIRSLCREYATVTITDDWPAMAREQFSSQAFAVVQQLWDTLLQSRSAPAVANHDSTFSADFHKRKSSRHSTLSPRCPSIGGFVILKAA